MIEVSFDDCLSRWHNGDRKSIFFRTYYNSHCLHEITILHHITTFVLCKSCKHYAPSSKNSLTYCTLAELFRLSMQSPRENYAESCPPPLVQRQAYHNHEPDHRLKTRRGVDSLEVPGNRCGGRLKKRFRWFLGNWLCMQDIHSFFIFFLFSHMIFCFMKRWN